MNSFYGPIPYHIRHLSSLRLLNLSYNLLTGEIPASFFGFGRVRLIDLGHNYFDTEIDGSKFGKCEFLEHLKLSSNSLHGHIP